VYSSIRNEWSVFGVWSAAGPMRGDSAGTLVRVPESYEGACESLMVQIALAIDVLVWFFHFLLVNVFSIIFSLFRNIIMWNSLRLLWREKFQPVPGAPQKACFALLNFSCPAQPGENHWPVASHWQTLSNNVVSPERESNSQR
jgi:hypothetical protein